MMINNNKYFENKYFLPLLCSPPLFASGLGTGIGRVRTYR
jgi:hypothetical protein